MTGRRGHVQSAFTIKELRELSKIDGCLLDIHEEELTAGMTEASTLELVDNRPKQRIVELITKLAMETKARSTLPLPSKPVRKVTIRFLLQPLAILSNEDAAAANGGSDSKNGKPKQVHHMVFVKNKLIGDAHHQRAVPLSSTTSENEGGNNKGGDVPTRGDAKTAEGMTDKEIITCDLVLKSVGYRSTPIEVFPF